MSFKNIIPTSAVAFIMALLGSSLVQAAGSPPATSLYQSFAPGMQLIPAQSTGEGTYGGSDYGGDDYGDGQTGAAALAPITTAGGITKALGEASEFCQRVPAEYAIDCLAYEYWEIQRRMPHSGEFDEAKKVLRKTATELKQLAAKNRSRSKPPATLKRGGAKPRTTTRRIVPVETANIPELKLEAARIINNGATLLLRATGDSDRKRAQYQQIAQSMQSGAILLRSL